MDYEKKYNEALSQARFYYGNCPTEPEKKKLENIFPELRESEDERIRKAIVHLLEVASEAYLIEATGFKKERFLYYLEKQKDAFENGRQLGIMQEQARQELEWTDEKQKEQKPEHFELKAGKWYFCHRAFCCRADHLTVKEGERFMCEKDGVVKGFVIEEPEKYFIECSAPAPMEDEQKEQNPAEWSEEDEKVYNNALDALYYKDLNDKDDVLSALKDLCDLIIRKRKVIPPYSRWKPSEEQIKNLEMCFTPSGVMPDFCVLESLYNDLNKLMNIGCSRENP